MSIQLGMHLTPSFAEFCLADPSHPKSPLLFHRVYIPQKGLAAAVRGFLSQCPIPPERFLVSSSFLGKILDSRLGGTVAQLVTAGFEDWSLLRQSLQNPFLELSPVRTEPLASQDLIFGVNERMSADGEVLIPLAPESISGLLEKLREKNVQRVCVNLLFAGRNPTHRQQLCHALREAGLEVFSADTPPNCSDEIQIWRLNALNAALSGSFQEVQTLLQSALTESGLNIPIEYINADLDTFTGSGDRLADSLFATSSLLARSYKSHNLVVSLGLEAWQWLRPQELVETWRSPWGEVAGLHPSEESLAIQPTSEILLDEFLDLNLSRKGLGYEPGPMAFGRSVKPLLLDLLHVLEPLPDMENWRSFEGQEPKSKEKFLRTMQAMMKGRRDSGSARDELTDQLVKIRDRALDHIAMQCSLAQTEPHQSILVTGYFAPMLYPQLKKRWPDLKWDLCPYSQERICMAIHEASPS